MGSELEEIARQHHESQAKYIYFLLAVAASGIAFAIQRTTGQHLRLSMIPLGLAIISWGYSFYAGCSNRQYHISTLFANGELFKVITGTHPDVPNRKDFIEAAANGIKKAMAENSDFANDLGHRQFRFIIIGAILFIAWHVLEML